MSAVDTAVNPPAIEEASVKESINDFSLAAGGPMYRLLHRPSLARDGFGLVHRRIALFLLFTWIPLLLLTLLAPHTRVTLSAFLRDIAVHTRFLVALPILIAAELLMHSRIPGVIRTFVDFRLISSEDMPRLKSAINSTVRLLDSASLELWLLVFVYVLAPWIWNDRATVNVAAWCGSAVDRWQLTPAGYWYVFVAMPIFLFILLRWYVRILIWFRLLWQISRINLNLISTHPDRCLGISFVGKSSYVFSPILLAQGAVLSGIVATRVLKGENLLQFKVQALGFVVFFVAALLAPLMMFSPKMLAARRKARSAYGAFAQRYVESFDRKWVRGGTAEEPLGTSDIQSLADLANSYDIIREIRILPVPFGLEEIIVLSSAAIAPLLPLLLLVFSPEELLVRVLKMVF